MKTYIKPTTKEATEGIEKAFNMIRDLAKLNNIDPGHFINALMLFLVNFKKANGFSDKQLLQIVKEMTADDNYEESDV